jgi:glycosyltransferase involved in cell wall biosynthesis
VGSTVPRKRIPLLLEAVAQVAQAAPVRLVRVGGPLTPEQRCIAADGRIADSIAELPFLDRRTLAAVYRRAALVVNPSEREGFGLPLVEAMACGAPVLAADLTVLREVGGGAARYVAADDADAWAQAIGQHIERLALPKSREAARQMALDRAQRFTLASYAQGITDVYDRVMAEVGA